MPYTCSYCKRYIVLGNEHTSDCGRGKNAQIQLLMVATTPPQARKPKHSRLKP